MNLRWKKAWYCSVVSVGEGTDTSRDFSCSVFHVLRKWRYILLSYDEGEGCGFRVYRLVLAFWHIDILPSLSWSGDADDS